MCSLLTSLFCFWLVIMSGAAVALVSSSLDETSERLSKWNDRWSNDRIGWHRNDVHESLLKYESRILMSDTCPSDEVRILVPLCGKTVDLAYLANKPQVDMVVGVDGIRKALEEFAAEQPNLQISSSDEPAGAFEQLLGNSISLLKGDFFALDDAATGGKFDAVWDRASIVAIQPNMRELYVEIMGKLVKPGATLLVSTLDRRSGTKEGMEKGPPFSVPESEVRRLYESQEWVESITTLEEIDEFEKNPSQRSRYEEEGVTSFFELVFEIKAKGL